MRARFSLVGLILLLAALGPGPGGVRAAPPGPAPVTQTIVAFDAANKFYEQGRFAESAAGYQQLIDGGQSSTTLYYNLGNAWFKAGQIGRAIAAYRQAERLSPREPSVQFNLNFARKRVTSGEPGPRPLLERVMGGLTLNEWTLLAATAFWFALLLLAAGELRESFRPTARRYALAAALSALLFSAGVAGAARRWFHPAAGVVVVSQAIVRSGPLEEAKVMHQFRDGTEVEVLDRKQLAASVPTPGGPAAAQVWFQVRNGSGQIGWVKDDQLMLIR